MFGDFVMDMAVMRIVIIAGPNGAGKTTFAREFLINEAQCPQFLNTDLIAGGLSPFDPERAAVRAARLARQMMDELVDKGDSFAFETTLSGRAYVQRIAGWQKIGYHVTLIYLLLSTVDLAIARVAERVSQGGHSISEDIVRRRFIASWRNFNRLYRPLVDAWQVYDNSGAEPVLIDWGEKP